MPSPHISFRVHRGSDPKTIVLSAFAGSMDPQLICAYTISRVWSDGYYIRPDGGRDVHDLPRALELAMRLASRTIDRWIQEEEVLRDFSIQNGIPFEGIN